MTRYYAEEPCEKCGECHQGAYYRWDGDDATQCLGPGGVRRELTEVEVMSVASELEARGFKPGRYAVIALGNPE